MEEVLDAMDVVGVVEGEQVLDKYEGVEYNNPMLNTYVSGALQGQIMN